MDSITTTKGGEFVMFTAPLKMVEQAFGVKYLKWAHSSRDQELHRATEHPTLPAELEDHVDFVGHVYELPHSFSAHGVDTERSSNGDYYYDDDDKPADDDKPSGTDTKVTPSVIFSAYGISPHTATSGKSTMAVFETLGQAYSPSDLSTFQEEFKVPAQKVADVIGPNKYSTCATNPNNCGEANLDVQYIIGVAQSVPLTFWSIAADATTPYYDWIVAVANDNNPPFVQSVSYGDVEQQESSSTVSRTNTEFQKMGVRGLSLFVASGDDGVANFPARSNSQYCGFNPSWPAASPYVTAVGATQFIGGSPANGQEGASVDNSPPAIVTSGGGFSTFNSRPSYQSSAVENFLQTTPDLPPVHTASGFPSAGFNEAGRAYPDLSALGHNYQVVINGNVYTVDGTSAASPVTAAMFALINDQRFSNGQGPLGFLNPTLYQLAGQGSAAITDVTEGKNNCAGHPAAGASQVCCTYGFSAGQGWDPVSGLGTVSFQDMASALVN